MQRLVCWMLRKREVVRDKFRSKPEYKRIRTRKGVRTTRRLDERQKRDEEVKVPHARLKVSRLTDARTSILEETLASVRLKN